MKTIFKGSGVALVTPFHADKSIDFEGLRKLVELQLASGTDYLVVQGTTGESPTLTWEEKLLVLEAVQKVNQGKLKIVFGVGGNNTAKVVEQLQNLPSGIDGILSSSPNYNKPTQKGIVAHYEAIEKATDLPIILYNVPGRTGSNIEAATTLQLAELENIVAIKEASGDLGQIMEILRSKPKGFEVISGDDPLTYPMITLGAVGVISVALNAFPEKFAKMVSDALQGNWDSAKINHFDLLPITNMLFAEGSPGGVKTALETRKICSQDMRLPLVPISKKLAKEIQEETMRLLA